eukprot:355743-Hanusia_phi.AAC.1
MWRSRAGVRTPRASFPTPTSLLASELPSWSEPSSSLGAAGRGVYQPQELGVPRRVGYAACAVAAVQVAAEDGRWE